MNPDDLLAQINALDTDDHDVAAALAFIRLVVKNNPTKTAAEIVARTDVQEALSAVNGWIFDARAAVAAVAASVPGGEVISVAANDTLSKLQADMQVEDRIGDWRASDEQPQDWAAKIVLRMQWFIEWLLKMADWAALDAPFKRWRSQLDQKTCTYCRGLHGVILPAAASFATEAAKLGYTRIYGGLFAPPLHPRCRCTLEPLSQAEAEALFWQRAS